MSCRGFDNLVLLEFNLGKLPADEERRVRLHLEHCEDCRAALAEITPMATAMAETRRRTDVDLNEDSVRKIMEAGRVVLKGFRPVPLQAEPATPAAPAAPVVTAVPVTPAWVPAPTVAALPAEPVRAVNPMRTSVSSRRSAFRRWAAPAAAAAGVVAALLVWVLRAPEPKAGDAWAELERRASDDKTSLAELKPYVVAAAKAEVNSDRSDTSGVIAVVADLEFAAWICGHAGDERQKDTVANLVKGVASRRNGPPPANGHGMTRAGGLWESEAQAQAVADQARKFLQSAWASRESGNWAQAARDVVLAAGALPPNARATAADKARLRFVSALYQWEDGRIDAALQEVRTAAADHNRTWAAVAYLYRWGLGNDQMAAWAFLHLRDEKTLKSLAVTPGFAGLPTLIFPGDFESGDGVSEDDWYRSHYGSAAYTGVLEDGHKVLRQTELTDEPADWLTRHRHYLSRESNYTVQVDLRFDELQRGEIEPWLGLYAYWTQQERNYRLVVRQNSIQFSKRRPPLPGEIPGNGHFVEYLLPAGEPRPLSTPLATGAWYTAKVQVRNEGGGTRLRAKLWPRDTREPAGWMLDELDPGAAGPSKYAAFTAGRTGLTVSRAKMSFDNILVAANP